MTKLLYLLNIVLFIVLIYGIATIEDEKEEIALAFDKRFVDYSESTEYESLKGYYNDKSKNIIIFTGNIKYLWFAEKVFYHEWGHTIWYRLTNNKRDEYKLIYNNTDFYVSTNAKGGVQEDFADSYSAFKTDGLLDDERLRFMEGLS